VLELADEGVGDQDAEDDDEHAQDPEAGLDPGTQPGPWDGLTDVRAQLLGLEVLELNGGVLVVGGHGWPFVDRFVAASVWHRSGWPCQEELGTRWMAWRKLTMP